MGKPIVSVSAVNITINPNVPDDSVSPGSPETYYQDVVNITYIFFDADGVPRGNTNISHALGRRQNREDGVQVFARVHAALPDLINADSATLLVTANQEQ